jgi:hypothetical protein
MRSSSPYIVIALPNTRLQANGLRAARPAPEPPR